MREKLSLNKLHLQLIAITAMVIDHAAWGFVDLFSPAGQIMHIIGRLTIPIMCFCVAEGFRKTGDLRRYIRRMGFFAVISIIPFYFFFSKDYGFRQNIIFDHLLSLLLLAVLENKKLKKWQKVLLSILIFGVSAGIGGWPIFPQLITLVFYYGKSFREKVKWFVFLNLLLVAVISVLSVTNKLFHYASFEWNWYDRLYLLGFMLALPILSLYNGEKGKAVFGSPFLGKYFFYIFYPVHLLILSLIVFLSGGNVDRHNFYLWFHMICLVIIFAMIVGVMRVKGSRMQAAVVMFLVLESVYIVGFIVEITATTVETFNAAAAIEYFGELLMLVAFLRFASECGRIRIPLFIYVGLVVAALALDYSVLNNLETGFFYSEINLFAFDGHVKAEYVHSTGYYLSVIFIFVVIAETFLIVVNSFIKGTKIERRRMVLLFSASMFIWIPYAITMTGITGGYEIPGFGVVGAAILFTICFFKYGSLDAVALASVNALGKAGEGVIIIDDRLVVTFTNSLADGIVESDSLVNTSAKNNKVIAAILGGELTEMGYEDKVYEIKVDELKTSTLIQGYTIWFIDATKHKAQLDEAENMAFHDALTGIYNRRQFEKLVGLEIEAKKPGTLVISDMDNFKSVNDNYGHKRGDKVLKDYADILMEYPEEELYPCRIGGDEFMFYLRGVTDRERIDAIVTEIMKKFSQKFRGEAIKCTLSLGIEINGDPENLSDFGTMYHMADEKLYSAKNSGKNTYVI